MSAYSREILLATSFLCSSRGSMQLLQLHRKLLQRCDITEEDFCFIVRRCPRFLLVGGPAGDGRGLSEDCTVVAKTSLRLCRSYGREEQCGGCQQLHLCKFFIYGNCRFGRGRKPCKFSHDIRSGHNYRLLRECTLHELSEDDLFLLLLQNDPTLLPEVCLHYNKGSGPHGCCTFQNTCTKVHLCQHFVQGTCMFGLKCKRQHAIDENGRRMLEERGLSGDIIRDLPFIYRNVHHLSAAAAATSPTEDIPDATDETVDICLHYIRNSCKFHTSDGFLKLICEQRTAQVDSTDECRRVHFHLPYKWEVFDGNTWTDLQHMEDIERDFCDPSKTQSSGDRPVDFLTMTRDSQRVRRLSTVSSVTKPPHYMLTTGWRWYYKGDQGKWVEYGQPDDKNRTTSVTSRTLEETFLSDRTAEVKVLKGQREYVISFTDMYQRNPKHNTKRKVRRRPRFVSVAEVVKQVAQ
ncbi:protein mono-ADP-ribosyltransferase PARP12b isoform X2 [Toxotes jaculatrix]|uniref:protein mono-ADP-ribosyltransferase PARP12b isoform X2 n=1 Tax=Toxotes jaculatrix TaxID=941984 RepID=UPI001B3AC0FB|nr:protein mono-ADP-ribosyltransferase PARP12b isoform X2 [Toxotes jaculatrix]